MQVTSKQVLGAIAETKLVFYVICRLLSVQLWYRYLLLTGQHHQQLIGFEQVW